MPAAASYPYGPSSTPRRSAFGAAEPKSFFGRMYALIQERLGANVLFLSSILIGFFHGWMKLHNRSAIMTFAFDIPLTLSLLVVIATAPKSGGIFPKGPISTALKFLIATCAIYGILPFGVPPLVAMAAFRGWCFIPLIFLLGYYLTTSLRQIEIFTYLLMGLGLVTAVYGLRQTPEEVRAMIESDPYMALRLQNNFYGSSEGAQFRVFSTFVSSAAFGGTMAFCSVFALSRMAVPGCSWKERIFLLGITGPMSYAMILSGSRTALIMLLMALLFTGWYRRTLLQIAVPAALVVGVFAVISVFKGGASAERFGTLLNPSIVLGRMRIVYGPAYEVILSEPLGGGLGRSGHGVPSLLGRLVSDFDWRPIDGDLGRLAVDMGIVGLVVFFLVLIVGGLAAFRMLKDVRESGLATVALPAGAWFLISAICMPIGSPFLSIPVGPLTWFFLGALLRLHEEFKGGGSGTLPMQNQRLASFIETPRATLYGSLRKMTRSKTVTPKSQLGTGGLASPTSAGGQPSRRRFLFRKETVDRPVFQAPPARDNKRNESRARRPRF